MTSNLNGTDPGACRPTDRGSKWDIARDNLNQLEAELPLAEDPDLGIEDQARSVLRLLLGHEGALANLSSPEGPEGCPNCGAPVESLTSPYCSEACRDTAAFVRQFRAALAQSTIHTVEKQVVFGQRLWWLLGGGLPLRETLIPESAKRQVSRRADGKCETCGAPMTGVENIGSGCNRPLHLRAVCDDCGHTRSFTDVTFRQRPDVLDRSRQLAHRILANPPIRRCDDPDVWDWRAFLAARRAYRTQTTKADPS